MRPSPRFIPRRAALSLVIASASFLMAACHHGARVVAPGVPQVAVINDSPRMTDGGIVAVVLAANNTDLSYARLVPSRSTNAQVTAFAALMTTDHTILNARASEIAARNHIEAEDNAVSLDFRDHSATRRDVLREFQGAKFDSTYIANEIQYHQELLAALDGFLIRATHNAELREFVSNLKPAVSAHLAHAERVRASLASRK